MQHVELIGYLASILVAVSLTMSNIWRLRWINLAGALLFALYGFLLPAYPVMGVNGIIAMIDVYYLVQMVTRRDYFSYVEVTGPTSRFLEKFLDFYGEDIRRFFPGFDQRTLSAPQAFFVLRNLLPVGVFLYTPREGGELEILLDYVIPEYRDLKNAQFLFAAHEHLASSGFHTWIARSEVPVHQSYLRRIGFHPVQDSPGLYRKSL